MPSAAAMSCNELLYNVSTEVTQVYQTFPEHWALMVLNLKRQNVDLIESPKAQPSMDGFTIEYYNHGKFSQTKQTPNSILKKMSLHLGIDMTEFLQTIVSSEKGKEIKVKDFAVLVESLVRKRLENEPSAMNWALETLKDLMDETPKFKNSNGKVWIKGFYYRGRYYSYNQIEILRDAVIQDQNVIVQLFSNQSIDGYLYRAPDNAEWDRIIRREGYLVPVRTNFESKIGPQVTQYARADGYAGVVIRIKEGGPFFRKGGMAVPRIESVLPHFAEVEVFKDGNWISIQQFKTTVQ